MMTINQTAAKNSGPIGACGQKIAEVQHHAQRQDIADPYDLRLGVIGTYRGCAPSSAESSILSA